MDKTSESRGASGCLARARATLRENIGVSWRQPEELGIGVRPQADPASLALVPQSLAVLQRPGQ
ncbi:MAG TPA: hypothetical protein VMU94_21855 [Streptosporangiaceae bacterium]|nr:hypothetical protein [Streptosporangiaceae bacterium]